MKHLTVDEMIRFVSLRKLDEEAMALCAVVNGHIRRCAQCLQAVRSFQMISDQLTGSHSVEDLRHAVRGKVAEEEAAGELLEDLEGER